MRRTAIIHLVLIALVVFSGCNAFDGSNAAPLPTPAPIPTDSPQSTATATPTRTITPTDTQLLPQQCVPVSQIGFETASAIATAHNATVWNTSFTVRMISTSMHQNGTVVDHSATTIHIAENHSRIHRVAEQVGPQSPLSRYERREIWTNGEQVVTREVSGHATHYGARTVSQGEMDTYRGSARALASEPEDVLHTATACVTGQFRHNGTAIFRLAFVTSEPPATYSRTTTLLRPVAGRAIVDTRGVIHEIRLDYVVRSAGGQAVTVTQRISYTDIGSTTVERPVWYEVAVNESQTSN